MKLSTLNDGTFRVPFLSRLYKFNTPAVRINLYKKHIILKIILATCGSLFRKTLDPINQLWVLVVHQIGQITTINHNHVQRLLIRLDYINYISSDLLSLKKNWPSGKKMV